MPEQLVLVDDEPGLREAVQAYLEDSGYTVHTASNAREGWDTVQRVMPDLVITDIMMPQVSGLEFLKQLRDDPRFETLPVIFLTARGMTNDRIQGYDAGCDAYLPKPFDPDELVAIVTRILKQRAAAKVSSGDSDADIAELSRQIAEIRAILMQRGAIAQTPAPMKLDFTPREQSVLDLVVDGLMNKEIARRLDTSVRNVEKYVSRLFSKTGTNSRTELVRFALEHGLTTPASH
ncbi:MULTISPECIES: response regulator transcription factor [Leptolyngbya]|jgi:DNA-binding NarL/FixJ family response regulator|uniref:Two component transcriptional regulator, LuxR family protein n=2 Tax=Leptolyngbya boryana TaxID=1184 RepID=A0A1Z4JMC3_LEPBY|nr:MULTISPECIES: response regulator transcription factor [Leptolyngbya]BAY57892.1 two component transcriptional regulator, LuxR family protein [Leptolyngbya boryana NIES-2135]MBD1854539.1 response regulator transcription factor [Leptolyngbya sp. FACHB-1624]MBD2367338.1 response regulator transcription factor [Leptolyngbya sp. FACHB-161]MBD2373862.1 response regulator transcription factor [Leptolyngbya sp. FACHB-238]MBD2398338.1 response regulator transcription factor [Leptolyngbya sp. FACHB-23